MKGTPYNELALFAGAGGGILGGALLGWNCIGACEIEEYPRRVLLQRQADGILPRFPVWDDVRTFDGHPWRGLVDVVSGGFPCQDISCAGRGAGITGARSGLWSEMCRIIGEVRPRYAFMENSPNLTSRGLGRVLGDLAEIGYHAAWMCLSAADCGAWHKRERIWILAHDTNTGSGQLPPPLPRHGRPEETLAESSNRLAGLCGHVPHPNGTGQQTAREPRPNAPQIAAALRRGEVLSHPHLPRLETRTPQPQQDRPGQPMPDGGSSLFRTPEYWHAEPGLGRMAHGVAHRVDRIKAIGNGQVPLVAARAFITLQQQLTQIFNA